MRLPDPARSRAVLIGTAEYGGKSDLPSLPAVANNLDDLHAALADPAHGWLTPHAGTKILNPDSPDRLGTMIAEQAARADDLMLIYYAGHGLLSPRGELYLATMRTSREQLRFTAFPFDAIREILNDSPAANRVVILDCCYSGRAIAAMADPPSAVYDQLDITGTYILTSTTATDIAHAPDGARHTAFTGELIRLLRDGDPEVPELVSLDHIYRATCRSLTRQGLPRPQQRGSNATPHLALVRNHALDRQPCQTGSPLHAAEIAGAVATPGTGSADASEPANPDSMPVPVGAFLALLTTVTFIATLVASFKLAGPASRVVGTTVFNTMQHDATHYQTASNVAKVLGSAASLAVSFGPTLALAGICSWLSDHGPWTWLGQHGFWKWVMHTEFGQCLNLTFGSGHRWYARTWGVVTTLVFLFTIVGTPFILLGIAAGWLD